MKHYRIILLAVGLLFGTNGLAGAAGAEVTFRVTDVPGHWFDIEKDGKGGGGSLAIVDSVPGGTTIHFKQKKQ